VQFEQALASDSWRFVEPFGQLDDGEGADFMCARHAPHLNGRTAATAHAGRQP
jgi:hypothetical protein